MLHTFVMKRPSFRALAAGRLLADIKRGLAVALPRKMTTDEKNDNNTRKSGDPTIADQPSVSAHTVQEIGTNPGHTSKHLQQPGQNAQISNLQLENHDDFLKDPSMKLSAEYIPEDIKSTLDGDGGSNPPLIEGKREAIKAKESVGNEIRDIPTTSNRDSDSKGDNSTNTSDMKSLSVSKDAAQGSPLPVAKVTTVMAEEAPVEMKNPRQPKDTPQPLSPALVGRVASLDHKVRGLGVRNDEAVPMRVLMRLT